jgi:hypothetical protein
MNTCNTCQYWSSRLNIVKNIADCDMPDNKNITFEIDATADDNSNMNVTLLTSGNFGCILHEPKITKHTD